MTDHMRPGKWTDSTCGIHLYHSPRPQYVERHHILPLAWGGKDEPGNVVLVCPTGHANIHRLLEEYRVHNGTPPWKVRRQYSWAERGLAEQGWRER